MLRRRGPTTAPCRNQRCYPGLIVHGPLQAALLIEFGAKLHGGEAPKTFTYRGLQPLFDGSEFSVNASATGDSMELWTRTQRAHLP